MTLWLIYYIIYRMKSKEIIKVLIVGGGFGGVKAAQILGRDSRFHVRLIDPKSYMGYHAAVYRLATGHSAQEVCIPYTDLLKGINVELVKDAVVSIDPKQKKATGASGSVFAYDELVLAVGCESSYFGIKGVEENAFSINTVDEALELRRHIHELFEQAKTSMQEERVPLLHIAVIGGGASGTEIAGEFAAYTKSVAVKHGVAPSLVTIDLIEAMPKILPALPDALSAHALTRLHELGVNVYLNRSVIRESVDQLFLKDMQMTTKTVVWTAGLKANRMAGHIAGATLDKRGRVIVNEYLQAKDLGDLYVIGDIASTQYSGMAQTAIADATFVASDLKRRVLEKPRKPYTQPAPSYAVPVGPRYAVVFYHGLQFHGRIGWLLRRAADLRAFASLLGLVASFRAWRSGGLMLESCETCRARPPNPKMGSV